MSGTGNWMLLAPAALSSLAWYVYRRRLAGTTLVGSWDLAIASLWGLSLAEWAIATAGADTSWARPLRFAAAVGLFSPTMMLLGAKRPQHAAWLFVVLSLWGVLALPAVELMLLGRAEDLQLADVRAWFLAGLVGLELVGRLGTRFWLAAWLQAAAQLLLLGPYLPWFAQLLPQPQPVAGLWAAATSIVLYAWPTRRQVRSLDRVWQEFRDLFGVAWSLRVAERINAAAAHEAWTLRLEWQGFVFSDSLSLQQQRDLRQTVENLLRRFVSADWLADRWPDAADRPQVADPQVAGPQLLGPFDAEHPRGP